MPVIGKSRNYGPITPLAGPGEPFWLEKIKHQGIAPFSSDPTSYKVFRNVKDFGAVGDGVADDTAAINRAISTGNRCGGGKCDSSTRTPAVIYFPAGRYRVTTPIIAYYYSQLIGDARNPPTLVADARFTGMAVIDADPYIPGGGGAQWYTNQNNFFRSVRNFVIDLRQMPVRTSATGLHWQVSQATSLMNIVFHMSTAPGNAHQGIWMENGSGGYMGDMIFNGGKFGMWVGNQQFTVRNVTMNNCDTAVYSNWNWGWTFQDIYVNNCQVGFDIHTGGTTVSEQGVGSVAIIDGEITNTPVFVRSSSPSANHLTGAIILNNIRLQNVPVAVGVLNIANPVLPGTPHTTRIASWGQGNVFRGADPQGAFVQADLPDPHKPECLLDGATGRIFGRTHPQYEDYSADQFVSVRDYGAVGNGVVDDTEALRTVIAQFSGEKIIFLDAGVYYITDTIYIPAGTQIVGEGWSVIMGGGDKFKDMLNPEVMIRVGEKGEKGIVEITDIIFSTQGSTPGAIIVEWNINSEEPGGAGMWDTHIRLGGAAGTHQDVERCRAGTISAEGYAAFLALHLTRESSAYLEGTWVWLADHDLDDTKPIQISLFSGRGILSESQGPVWMIGTGSEHHVLYQYNLVDARNHYMGLIQTETPYYQPLPTAPIPFAIDKRYKDPKFSVAHISAWAVNIVSSREILIFGAGLYSFFHNYKQDRIKTASCQPHLFNIDRDSCAGVSVFGLSTVGVTWMLSVDGEGVIASRVNPNGFAHTATSWSGR